MRIANSVRFVSIKACHCEKDFVLHFRCLSLSLQLPRIFSELSARMNIFDRTVQLFVIFARKKILLIGQKWVELKASNYILQLIKLLA